MGIPGPNAPKLLERGAAPLYRLQVLFQSVSGQSGSHFKGFRGHSENGGAVSTAGGSISLFRTDDIRKSYTCFIEMSSILAIECLRSRMVLKNSSSK